MNILMYVSHIAISWLRYISFSLSLSLSLILSLSLSLFFTVADSKLKMFQMIMQI